MNDRIFSASFTNSRNRPIEIILEPWGDYATIAAGENIRISAQGPSPGELEFVLSDDSLTIYGWPGSIVQIFDTKGPLLRGDIPAPTIRSPR